MKKNINELWLTGLKDQDRDEMKKLVINNTILLDKLKEMLYNMQEGKRGTVVLDYDTPSWSHKQAHLNGELAALKKVQELLTVVEREDHPTT